MSEKVNLGEIEEKVSGIRKFPSGAIRSDDAESARFDLISPIALLRLAQTYNEGALKYPAHNYLKGIPASDLMNHALRHIMLWMAGDRSEPHIPHAVWGLCTLIHFEETRADLMDMPPYQLPQEVIDLFTPKKD